MVNMNSDPASRNAVPASHMFEYLVLEEKADGEFAFFESKDWQEAGCRAREAQRQGRKVRLAVTIPPNFEEPIKGYAVGMDHEYPLSFHRFLEAANAVATRYVEATGEVISYENAVAFIIPGSAVVWQHPSRATEEKRQQPPQDTEKDAA